MILYEFDVLKRLQLDKLVNTNKRG